MLAFGVFDFHAVHDNCKMQRLREAQHIVGKLKSRLAVDVAKDATVAGSAYIIADAATVAARSAAAYSLKADQEETRS
ncbi:unnamed protein product [Sphagnum tenellum]